MPKKGKKKIRKIKTHKQMLAADFKRWSELGYPPFQVAYKIGGKWNNKEIFDLKEAKKFADGVLENKKVKIAHIHLANGATVYTKTNIPRNKRFETEILSEKLKDIYGIK